MCFDVSVVILLCLHSCLCLSLPGIFPFSVSMSLVSWCGASGVCCDCWGGVGGFSLGSPVAVCLFSKCYACVCCLLLASVLVPMLLSVFCRSSSSATCLYYCVSCWPAFQRPV